MRAVAFLPVALLLGSPAHSGTVEVKLSDAGLDVHATAAPLSDVLERISRQTGMKVVYEGTPARAPITANVQRATAAEVVMSLLEGQGVSYALVMDVTGTRVETLMMVNSSGPGSTASSGPLRSDQKRGPLPPRPEPVQEEPAPEPEEEPETPEAPPGARPGGEQPEPGGAAPAAAPTPFPTSPFAPQPVSPFVIPQPGMAPGGAQPPVPGLPAEAQPGASPTPPPPEPRP